MGDVSKHFNRKEFECRCGCGFAAVDVRLLEVLELVRVTFNKSVNITSACRCDAHNASVGGKSKSKHRLGIAADIVVRDVKPGEVYELLDSLYPNMYGLGNYETFTHLDVRKDRARW
tara:strand:- start:1337 stop:1687 length:351 start_codon:yes stop_codon:yes gene_type:complete